MEIHVFAFSAVEFFPIKDENKINESSKKKRDEKEYFESNTGCCIWFDSRI